MLVDILTVIQFAININVEKSTLTLVSENLNFVPNSLCSIGSILVVLCS